MKEHKRMIKKIAAGILALGLLTSPVSAAEVFRANSGQWTVHGHKSGNDMSCVLSTFYSNGAQINVNVFPRYDGTQYTTMTVTNPAWDNISLPIGSTIDAQIAFYGNRTGAQTLYAPFQVYSRRKVILRGLSDAFSDLFIWANRMVLFPNAPYQLTVGLVGTKNASYLLTNCINTVKYR